MEKKKAGRKPGKTSITVTVDKELYAFFTGYAEQERDTMAGILRRFILTLKKQDDRAKDTLTKPLPKEDRPL